MRGLILLLFLSCSEAHAYMDYAPNDHLTEEVQSNPNDRVFPHSDHYAFAVDGDFFKPVFIGYNNYNYYKYDFYHGNGYWVDFRGEFKPVQDLILNVKTDFTHGTSSNGATYLSVIVPHVGLTYRDHTFLGFDWEARLSDIERQTIGTGIFIEQKETEGGYLTAKRGIFEAKMMVDGTGSFQLDGGLIAFDTSLWNHLIGATFLIQETDNDFSPPQYTGTIYSKQDFKNGFGYGVEFGGNEAAIAGMAYLQYRASFFDHLNLFIKPQIRHYGRGILGNLPGNVNQNYVSYDQNDKAFTNIMDIFVYGDDVETYSSEVNLEYVFNSFYRVYVESEFLRYVYHTVAPIQSAYFRTGFKFYPFKNRDTEFGALIGNKYLIASTSLDGNPTQRTYSSPLETDLENKPLFLQQTYGMINISTKF